jgi:hypothetical protein
MNMRDSVFISRVIADIKDKVKQAGTLALEELLNSENPWMTLEFLREVSVPFYPDLRNGR